MTECVPRRWWRDWLPWFSLGAGAAMGLILGYWVAMEVCR